MRRLWGTIITRLTAPPLALRVHALLVLATAFVVADAERGGWWAGPAIVGVILWPLLRGSRLIWWVQLIAVSAGGMQAVTVRGRVVAARDGTAMFVDDTTLLLVAATLGLAGALLVLPPVRRYCRDDPRPLRGLGFGVAVLMLAGFPTMALGIESWLPSAEGFARGPFVGGDPERRVAFYVEEGPRKVCLSIVWIDGGTHSCRSDKSLPAFSPPFHAEGIVADVVPKTVAKVDVVFRSGRREAKIIDGGLARARVYYVGDAPPARELLGVVAYDAAGAEVFRGRLDY